MRKIILLMFSLLFFPLNNYAEDNEHDFGTWLEIGAKKDLASLPLSLDFQGELRTKSISTQVDRISLAIGATYKFNKYLKFNFSYAFIDSYKADKERYSKETYNQDGVLLSYRKRFTPGYWTPRHRFYFELTPTIKLARMLRVSLRERYQYTFTPVNHYTRNTYYYELEKDAFVLDYSQNGELRQEPRDHRHSLRSRLKLDYDKKGIKCTPYVSVELHNDLRNDFRIRKIRSAFGMDYKLNRHHSLGAAYILNWDCEKQPHEFFHALNISYTFKL